MLGTTGDQRGQLVALRDLGAFPPDVDLDAVMVDLDLEGPVKDPRQMSAEQLVDEMREITKKLLGYGARCPKELMLFVRNMMFLNGATAVLAPDLDMLQQMMTIYLYFAQTHGDQIIREVGVDAKFAEPDPDAVRAAFLVDSNTETLTYREMQQRRDEVRAKLSAQRKKGQKHEPERQDGAPVLTAWGEAGGVAGSSMPELPQMQALAERLAEELGGAELVAADPLGFSGLKTVVPGPDALFGQRLLGVGRRAKYLVLDFGADQPRMLVHLSQAGRLDIERPPKQTRAKGSVMRLRFVDAEGEAVGVLVREYGHERKAAWWVLAPGDDGPLERLGPEPDSDEFAEFVLRGTDGRRVHTILRDQRTVSGVGRGYADDALWRAQLSPYASLKSLSEAQRTALLDAVREVLAHGLELERKRTGGLSQPKLGEHFEVHNRYGTPCPALRRHDATRELREPRGDLLPDLPDRGKGARRPPHVAPRQVSSGLHLTLAIVIGPGHRLQPVELTIPSNLA